MTNFEDLPFEVLKVIADLVVIDDVDQTENYEERVTLELPVPCEPIVIPF